MLYVKTIINNKNTFKVNIGIWDIPQRLLSQLNFYSHCTQLYCND